VPACFVVKKIENFPKKSELSNFRCIISYFRLNLIGLFFPAVSGVELKKYRDQSRLTFPAASPLARVISKREPVRRLHSSNYLGAICCFVTSWGV
jgi:hypothetical protein